MFVSSHLKFKASKHIKPYKTFVGYWWRRTNKAVSSHSKLWTNAVYTLLSPLICWYIFSFNKFSILSFSLLAYLYFSHTQSFSAGYFLSRSLCMESSSLLFADLFFCSQLWLFFWSLLPVQPSFTMRAARAASLCRLSYKGIGKIAKHLGLPGFRFQILREPNGSPYSF